MRTLLAGMVFLLGCVATADSVRAGTIEVNSRNSYAEFDIFAGSGGATRRIRTNDQLTLPNGAFSFALDGDVGVLDSDRYSMGTASSTGLMTVSDSVLQPNASSLRIQAQRSATSSTTYVAGSATAWASLQQTLVVEFSVLDSDAFFQLSGSLDPGAVRNNSNFSAGRLSFKQLASTNRPFFFDTPGLMAASGVLAAGTSYRLELQMTDYLLATSGNAMEFDHSNLDFLFTVSPVPEPASALLFGVGLAALLVHRQRRSGKAHRASARGMHTRG